MNIPLYSPLIKPIPETRLVNIEAIRSIATSVERFTPIESKFPLWRTARIIEQEVPQEIRFTRPKRRDAYEREVLGLRDMDPNVLAIDSDWTARVMGITPPEDKPAMRDLLQSVVDTVSALIVALEMQEDLKALLYQPVDNMTVSTANQILAERLDACAMYGLPKPMEVGRHMLGLSCCLLLPQ